jgi:hypothetical protein
MGRASRVGWAAVLATTVTAMTAFTATVAAAVTVTAALTAAAPAQASVGRAHPSAPKLVQLGHATFWECPAKTTELLVAVNTLTLHPGATLTISFTVRNGGGAACNYTAPYAGVAPGPTAAILEAGPCGSVGFEILGPHHANVWPGVQIVNCPALGFAQLAANGTVSGSGSWNQTKPNSTTRVPSRSYTLVIDNAPFSFPLRVVAH